MSIGHLSERSSVTTPDLQSCIAYLRRHGIPTKRPRRTAIELSAYLAQRGHHYSPETLTEAATELGFEIKGPRNLIALAIRKPPTVSK